MGFNALLWSSLALYIHGMDLYVDKTQIKQSNKCYKDRIGLGKERMINRPKKHNNTYNPVWIKDVDMNGNTGKTKKSECGRDYYITVVSFHCHFKIIYCFK